MTDGFTGRPAIQRVVVDSLPDPMPSHHPHCVIAGDFVFLSGLVSERRGDGSRVGVEDGRTGSVHNLRVQLSSIFRQLDVILETAGSNKTLVVDVQVFLLEMSENFALMNEVYGSYFGTTVPARTTVEVVRFPSDVLIELKVIATVEKLARA
jgi:enamine deaminase RidA (YjgF/YER057c/UK114 family)